MRRTDEYDLFVFFKKKRTDINVNTFETIDVYSPGVFSRPR